MNGELQQNIFFEEFELDTAHRQLLRNGEQVAIYAKSFDLLSFLVENNGRILSKDEILETVWEGQVVEEANLSVQISALRKALNEDKDSPRFLVTVPGKGYKFVADVKNGNGDIIIEKRKLSRIVVEEKISEAEEIKSDLEVSDLNKKNILSRNNLFLLSGVLSILILLGGVFWVYKINKTNQGANEAFKNPIIKTYATNGMPQQVNISPSGKLLAYVGRKKGFDSIWVGNISTGNNIQITQPTNASSLYVGFSPDEEYVYFVFNEENKRVWNLNRVPVFGGAVQEVIKDVHSSITFSPDGEKIAFLRRETEPISTSLVIADAETGVNEKVFLNLRLPKNFAFNGVSWSPDGENIAAIISDENGKNYELTLISLLSGERKRIGTRFWKSSTNLVWQKDGKALILINPEKFGHDGVSRIWKISYPEGSEQKITNSLNNYRPSCLGISDSGKIISMLYQVYPQIWISPTMDNALDDKKVISGVKSSSIGLYGLAVANDEKLIYTAGTGNSQTIWEINADGSNQRQITPTNEGAKDSQMMLTAENHFIIFQSNRSGEYEIWRADRNGSNLKQITSGGGNTEPTLTPDGKWIIYTHYENDFPTLWRISINGGKAEQFSKHLASWAIVSPDGKYVASSYGLLKNTYEPRIAVFPIEGGKPEKIIPVLEGILYNRLRWTPDSKTIIHKDNKQGLWQIDVTNGEREKIDLLDDFRVMHFAWSANGKNFAYSGGELIHEVVILESAK